MRIKPKHLYSKENSALSEEKFTEDAYWDILVADYLRPKNDKKEATKEQVEKVQQNLVDLRDSFVAFFLFINVAWFILLFTVGIFADEIAVTVPSFFCAGAGFCNGSVPTNVSDSFYGISQSNDYQFYDYKLFDTNSERNCSKDSPDWEECENTLNPLSLLYLVFYVVLIIFQSIGMVLHRWQNMVIYSATANITKTKQQLESMPEGIRKTISKKTRAALEYFSLRYNSDFEGDYW